MKRKNDDGSCKKQIYKVLFIKKKFETIFIK